MSRLLEIILIEHIQTSYRVDSELRFHTIFSVIILTTTPENWKIDPTKAEKPKLTKTQEYLFLDDEEDSGEDNYDPANCIHSGKFFFFPAFQRKIPKKEP